MKTASVFTDKSIRIIGKRFDHVFQVICVLFRHGQRLPVLHCSGLGDEVHFTALLLRNLYNRIKIDAEVFQSSAF